MARIHDLGGREAHFGPIVIERDEPVFHARWEGRVFAITIIAISALGRNVDGFRATMERLPRAAYFAGYYQRWLAGLEARLVELGVLAPGELDAQIEHRDPASRGKSPIGRLRAWGWNRLIGLATGPQPWWFRPIYLRVQRYDRRARTPARFNAGDPVVIVGAPPDGHTRRPGYVWGHRGTVVRTHGAMVFPDAVARGDRGAQHLYTIAFAARELWGDGAEPGVTIHVDLFESYMEDAR